MFRVGIIMRRSWNICWQLLQKQSPPFNMMMTRSIIDRKDLYKPGGSHWSPPQLGCLRWLHRICPLGQAHWCVHNELSSKATPWWLIFCGRTAFGNCFMFFFYVLPFEWLSEKQWRGCIGQICVCGGGGGGAFCAFLMHSSHYRYIVHYYLAHNHHH